MSIDDDLDAAWFSRVTAWYLERYSTTTAHLRRLLRARVRRRGGGEHALARIEPELRRLQDAGLLDDAAWAEGRARSLHRRGASHARIRAALRDKGVDAAHVPAALEALDEESTDPELGAARTWARKRRLGPWRKAPADAEQRRRDVARMGRAGFPFELVRRVLDGPADD